MSIYHRHNVLPEWEPIPWDAKGNQVEEQERGFHHRALKPLVWMRVDWNNFPKNGIFGRSRDWFIRHDITHVTTFDGENLILIDNTYFDFPDPPRWGLASRVVGNAEAIWQKWGHFADLPAAWLFPSAEGP